MALSNPDQRPSPAPPYRDDLGPLREQLDGARRELDEVQAKLREAQGQQARRDELKDEIASLERELRGRERRRSLPLLDKIRVASPCDADWDSMEGDGRKRFCALCSKHVYNLSEMSRPEAEELLVASEGKLCVRYYQRADGTVLTQDCPVGLRKRRRRWVAVSALAFGGLAALAIQFVTAATTGAPAPLMGDIAELPPAEASGAPAAAGSAALPAVEAAAPAGGPAASGSAAGARPSAPGAGVKAAPSTKR